MLIFTIFDEEDKVLEAVKAGASGYLLKGASAEKIIEAIKEVKAGGTVIQPNLARRLLKHFRSPRSRAAGSAVQAAAAARQPRGAGDASRCPSGRRRSCSSSPRASRTARRRGC